MGKVLKREVREHLVDLLNSSPRTIANRISEIYREFPNLTPVAAAQVLAERKGKSIMRFLKDEDRHSLASARVPKIQQVVVKAGGKRNSTSQPKPLVIFPTTDPFIERHIKEINGTYHAACYTATFILCRKVMENLIVQILRKKFPSSNHRELYEDASSRHSLDFSIVLDNFYKQRTKFSISTSSAIERIKQRATPFKNDANDKAHSLYHVASKSEIEEANVQEIFDLITIVMRDVKL